MGFDLMSEKEVGDENGNYQRDDEIIKETDGRG